MSNINDFRIINGKLIEYSGAETEVEIPNITKKIYKDAFRSSKGIIKIYIPDSVVEISDGAFDRCSNLQYNEYGNALYLGNKENPYIVLIKAANKKIKECIVAKSARFILNDAFKDCVSLKTVDLPNTLLSIGKGAFFGCKSLETIYLPESLESIGPAAFFECASLKNIQLPKGVSAIYDATFAKSGLESITVPQQITCVGTIDKDPEHEFYYYGVPYGAFADCDKLNTVIFESHTRYVQRCSAQIGVNAFSNCKNITKFKIPEEAGKNTTAWWKNRLSECVLPIVAFENFKRDDQLTKYVLKDIALCLKQLVKANRIDLLSNMLTCIPNIKDTYIQEMLNILHELNCVEGVAILLEQTRVKMRGTIEKAGPNVKKQPTKTVKMTIDEAKRSYVFRKNENGITITRYIGEDNDVVIPSEIGKTPVVKIDTLAFNRKNIINVVIPESVKEIGSLAFYECESLSSIRIEGGISLLRNIFGDCNAMRLLTIPASVETIEENALQSFHVLTSLEIDENNNNYRSEDGIIYSKDGKILVSCAAHVSKFNVKEFSVPLDVITIGTAAFYNCTTLESVIIPDSITTIEDKAFYRCTSLKEVNISSKIKKIGSFVFSKCTSLVFVEIPKSITTISEGLFSHCTSLTDMCLHEKIKKIGDYAYTSCESLPSSIVLDGITSIGDGAFKNCTSIESIYMPKITKLPSQIFLDCHKLSKIVLSDGLESIGSAAFAGCHSIKAFSISTTIKKIVKETFRGCKNLEKIIVPGSVEKIGEEAFADCEALKSVEMANGVVIIETNAFARSGIESITIPSSVTQLSGFNNCKHLKNVEILGSPEIKSSAFSGCTELKEIKLPDGVTSVKGESFAKSGLVRIVIPGSVTDIGKGVFTECEHLETVILNDGVQKISQYAFSRCPRLSSLTIPESINYIDWNAFYLSKKEVTVYGAIEGGNAHTLMNSISYLTVKFIKK